MKFHPTIFELHKDSSDDTTCSLLELYFMNIIQPKLKLCYENKHKTQSILRSQEENIEANFR
jgi:hypothetical protein